MPKGKLKSKPSLSQRKKRVRQLALKKISGEHRPRLQSSQISAYDKKKCVS